MLIHQDAVAIAKEQDKWAKHPNKKRRIQTIQLIKDVGGMCESECMDTDVAISACVVHDTKHDEYHVFPTTDTEKTAKQIINIYELRPEIEED